MRAVIARNSGILDSGLVIVIKLTSLPRTYGQRVFSVKLVVF